jgi:lambda repressor-like predicted transcriptional regulator
MTQKSHGTATPRTPAPARPTDWHPADIKAALAKQGLTIARLAESHGLTSGSTFSKALTGSMPLAEARLAAAIGVDPSVIWPSRYREDGSRKPVGSHAIESSKRSKNAEAKAQGGAA